MSRSYTILGTGALGGYYGARLHHAGRHVRFLLHSDYEHVRTHGLRVDSVHGDLSIPEPEVYGAPRDLVPSDVVAVCLKTTANHLLPELLPPAVKSGGIVLMMQNGLGVEEDAARVLPRHTILGGLAFLCSNKIGPGHIQHLDYGSLRLAQYRADGAPAGITDELRGVAEDFERAGIEVRAEEDLARARWKKLVWNIPFNGLCVVHNCTTDVLMKDPDQRARAAEIMKEVLRAAAACGRRIRPEFVQTMLDATEKMIAYQPSMKLDYDRGTPLELEAIYARPLEAARAAGVDCPRIRELYEKLQELSAPSER